MSSEKTDNGSQYKERKITSIRELKTLLWGLDLDEGIRFTSEIAGYPNGAFFFVTKCEDRLCISIKEKVFDKNANAYVPGQKEQWKYFERPEAAWLFISKYLKPPFEAFYY